MLKCDSNDICGWTKCPHYKSHKEIINIIEESLCVDGYCMKLQKYVRCIEI